MLSSKFFFAKSFLLSWILTTVMNKVLEGRDLVPSKIWKFYSGAANSFSLMKQIHLFRGKLGARRKECEDDRVDVSQKIFWENYIKLFVQVSQVFVCCTSFVSATSASISEMLFALVTHVSLWRLSQISSCPIRWKHIFSWALKLDL